MRQALYENISRNFDIFEFIDDNNADQDQKEPHEGDDEQSDELEFQIDDEDLRIDHPYLDERQKSRVP